MSSLVAEIQARWRSLRGRDAPGPAAFEVSSLTIDTGHGPTALALSPLGQAQLLLPVASGGRRPAVDAPPALEITSAAMTGDGTRRTYVVVTCLDPALDRGFADLVEAVLTRIDAGEPVKDALAASIHDLGALFARVAPDRVEDRTVRGLVAELIVLRRLAGRDARAAVWPTPEPTPHGPLATPVRNRHCAHHAPGP